MKPLKRSTMTLLATGLAGALVGCSAEDPDVAPGQAPISVSPGDESGSADDSADDPGDDAGDDAGDAGRDLAADIVAGALAAIALAEQETGGTAFEIDDSDGGWEVEVAVGARQVDVTTNLDGTEVLAVERDGRLDGEDRAGLRAATTTLAEAIEIAVAEVPGILEEADLDDEGSGFVWEVQVEDGTVDYDVHVDVDGGTVLRVEED